MYVVGVSELSLRPIHYASLSGGKDSLYMLGVILANQNKYPLDLVVNFELEIEWDVSKRVVNSIEERCKSLGIPFMKIKPRKTWQELYEKYGFPNGVSRWCNKSYKLDCKTQLNQWIKSQNCRPLAYIGLCADEKKRFKYDIGDWKDQDVCYPLAEEGINESEVLKWARQQPIFEGYYDSLDRMGCKACPLASNIEWAYLLQKESKAYETAIRQIEETERMVAAKGRTYTFKKMTAKQFDKLIKTKWLKILENKQKYKQITIEEWLQGENLGGQI